MMTNDNLGDWRIDSVSTLTQSFGGAPAGSPVWLMSTAKHKKHRYLSFITPSAPALCLNVAIGAAALGEAIRPRLQLTPMITHDGKQGFQVRSENVGDLYYLFEQSIISVTMSFQAIEIFANAIIGRKATRNIVVRRKGGVEKNLTPMEAERELSTKKNSGRCYLIYWAYHRPRKSSVAIVQESERRPRRNRASEVPRHLHSG